MLPFRIKICGITTFQDALICHQAGAEAIGLNFVKLSPRYIPPEVAQEICKELPPAIHRIGVFVNSTANEILQTFTTAALTGVQLHGDEPIELVKVLRDRLPTGTPIIKAFRLKEPSLLAVEDFLKGDDSQKNWPDAILVDAYAPEAYGGTGKKLDWHQLSQQRKTVPLPIILAGGLTPENVSEAIQQSGCPAVDTASGVESSPPLKDANKVTVFIRSARVALGIE